jgi:hypothetical protein
MHVKQNTNQNIFTMKKQIITLSAFFIASTLVFSQDIISHFDPEVITPVADTYPGGQGYFTGHNSYGDEEFGEKYEINGNGTVHGMVAIHAGEPGTSTFNASYRLYSVAASGLPGTNLGNRSIPYNDIPIDEEPYTILFTNPIPVSDEFFVTFNLGDYSHGNPGTKKIALTHAPDGTRPATDFGVYGRNVIRWHSHGAPAWKDYRTENFQSYEPAVYFSLFPIVELEALSVIDFNQQANIGGVYPNPSTGYFTVPVYTTSGGEAIFQLFDITGKLIAEEKTNLSIGKTDYRFSQNKLNSGSYILLIRIPEGSISQKVIIK